MVCCINQNGYKNGKNHNIIVLAEGVMTGAELAEKIKAAGDDSDLRVSTLVISNVVVHQLPVTVFLHHGWAPAL